MIKKIKWAHYKNLGDMGLDFTDDSGRPFNTIVLAGENGTGKTTILDTLADFLNLGTIFPFQSIEYCVDGCDYRIEANYTDLGKNYGYHDRINLTRNTKRRIFSDGQNDTDSILEDTEDIRFYGVAYTRAKTGFNTGRINSTTTERLDQKNRDIDLQDDYTNIKQLLIDIVSEDNEDLKEAFEKNHNVDYEEFKISTRQFRFEKAFNNFFQNIKFHKVANVAVSEPVYERDAEKSVIFTKNGVNIPIDSLSTGEKQIVYRGTQLLRNLNSLHGGIVLIDEPELSMHPLWQEKILEYYRGLLTIDGVQTVQMIIATHSEYVVRSALKDKQNVLVIVLREKNNIIEADRLDDSPLKLPSITASETNYLAFNIASGDYHTQLYGYLQTVTNNTTVSACDAYIAQHPSYNHVYDKVVPNNPAAKNSGATETLCTYIRNAIGHPDSGRVFTDEELRISIGVLRTLLT